ncbi:hypothetical protein L7F22_016299 [Adiantum nelumboides]|nr:hypothetical protein [Adiantum nelumboides]
MAQQAPASLIPSTVRSYHLDKLTGTNYLTWATRVTLLLKRATLCDIVDGTTPKPGAADPGLADWRAKDLQAQAELMLHLGDRQVQMVRRCQTSAEIWTFLRATYHHEDLITRVTALKKLLAAVLTEQQATPQFVEDCCTLLDNALLSGLQLDDSLQSMLLLAALPSSWRPFITTQASVTCLTVETLIARILQEDTMRSGTSSSPGTNNPSAQYMQRSARRFAGRQSRRPFRRTGGVQRSAINNNTPATQPCGYCGRPGHVERECRTKHREQQRSNRPPRAHLQQVDEPAPSQYGMESLQLFSSHIHSDDALIPHSTVATSEWLLDTGATHHMTPDRHWLSKYTPLSQHVKVYLGDNQSLTAVGLGHMKVALPSGTSIIIHDIYHILGLSRNILSVTAATSIGSSIEFFHAYFVIHFKLLAGKYETLKLPQQHRLYPIMISKPAGRAMIASTSSLSLHLTKAAATLLWHYRLGHINTPTLHRMSKNSMCQGMPPRLSPIDLCEGCLLGKFSHKPFPRSHTRSTQVNQLVHSDLCGPMEGKSLTDYCSLTIRQHDLPIQFLRSNNGGEYISKEFQSYCKSEGIQQQYIVPYSPQQNGVSEWKNRSLVQSARAMLLTVGLPKSYWEEAVAISCYLQNRIPHSIDPQHTPYFHWFGKIPNLQHLRVFGCPAYPVSALALRQKFDATSTRMVFVGYGDRFGVKAYRLYDPQN